MKTPSIGALSLGAIPFVAMCFTVALWDRVQLCIIFVVTVAASLATPARAPAVVPELG